MKKFTIVFIFLLSILCSSIVFAAEVSSDKMILDWQTSKVWVDNGELYVNGTFFNKRNDITITKLNEFILQLTFIDDKNIEQKVILKPTKLPMCKITANGSKKINLNFGKFNYKINKWVTNQDYLFTYINGARF